MQEADFDFISVTHGAGGSLRGGTLPISFHSQKVFDIVSIAHLTCRGTTREDLENMLIDHHYFGIHNILALRGDPPDGINAHFEPVPGGFSYAYELVDMITSLNAGRYLPRKSFDKLTDFRSGIETRFCIGVACYPEDPDGKDIDYLLKKIDHGANFAITQMLLDFNIFENFIKRLRQSYAKDFIVLPGIRVPSSFKQLDRIKNKFGISVSPELYFRMEAVKGNPEKEAAVGLEWACDFTQKTKALGIRGVHFFIMGHPESAIEVKQFLNQMSAS